MSLHELEAKHFEEFIENNKLVFIDFWAEWCAPCKQFSRVYEQVAEQNPTIKFAKVNIEKEAELADIFQIRSIPHLMVFKEGIAIYSEAGSMPESVLKDLVQQAINADVSEIREKIDKGEI
ncbi:thioredoxin family protein [Legionella brunensis]|uniref:Thioredoxin n=1 Tax=Legionella brunensis TaxID=29422 RepID=A0A0W0S533_9GAMM|nr:thioredoxin family protein [Legionella brunensis]KTC78336.1 thioredoxin [Legionella brunensis]